MAGAATPISRISQRAAATELGTMALLVVCLPGLAKVGWQVLDVEEINADNESWTD